MVNDNERGIELHPAIPPATPTFSAEQYQGGGTQLQRARGSADLPNGMASNDQFLQQLGMPCSTRTPAVMADVERASDEARKLFPSSNSTNDDLTNAAYRYIMNKEGIDDYSQFMPTDTKALTAAKPNVLKTLDDYVAEQRQKHLVPQGDLKEVEARQQRARTQQTPDNSHSANQNEIAPRNT